MASAGKDFFRKRYEQLGGKIVDLKLKPSIRVNTLKISAKNLIKRLESLGVSLERIPFTRDGYKILKSPFSMGAITEYLLGYYSLQESAAQLPVQVLNPRPDEFVLDMCAAPGGKSTQIAQLMKNKGTLVCYDLKPHRLTSLKTNLERCGVTNSVVFRADASKADKLKIQFDKVLLDAPCSGNFLSEPGWLDKRDLEGVNRNAAIQRKLLKSAVEVLKPGGTLVYSTCSLEPEEDELNVQWALDNLGVELKDTGIKIGSAGSVKIFNQNLDESIILCRKFWPHLTGTQGFFVAKMVKQ